jgi:DNA adenine methylase
VRENLLGKLKRMMNLEISMGKTLGELDLRDNIETGFRSGFYMHFRNLNNEFAAEGRLTEEKTAIFYFIREFCYGSMFRYNRKGHFNIPYGGIAYNKKNFKKKLDDLFLPETTEFFKKIELYNLVFE